MMVFDDRPYHWRPTYTYDPNADGTITPRWTGWWYLADADGNEVRIDSGLVQRNLGVPNRPLPDCAWEGERVKRSA